MLRYIEKENKKLGFKYKDYYLTQGDSFTLTATETGEPPVEEPVISRVVFKLGQQVSDCQIDLIYSKDYVKNEERPVWACKVSGEDTAKWKTTCECNEEPYVYEIEVEYSDGEPVTLTSGKFYIEPQITGGE